METVQKIRPMRNACADSEEMISEIITATLRWVYEMRMKSGTPYFAQLVAKDGKQARMVKKVADRCCFPESGTPPM